MSLILDALKKSEAERQLGRAPGLSTPMPLRRGETEEPRGRWLRYALWLAIAATGLALAWWLARGTGAEGNAAEEARGAPPVAAAAIALPAAQDAEPATRSAADAPAMPAAPAVRPTSDREAGDATIDPARHTPSGHTAAAPLAVPSLPPVVEAATPLPRDPEFDSVERESEATVAPSASVASAPPLAVPSPAPLPPAAAPVPLPAAVPTSEPATPTQTPGNGTVVAEAVEPLLQTLPRLDQLVGSQRDALPPLKQTMHVYAEAPAARFVLIDGHRYREGDHLSGALQLVEIRRDGTVLQFDGLRFLLPRP
jgi:general secretion pathway protein B